MWLRILLALCFALLSHAPARAGDAAIEARTVVRAAGLEGVWSLDCRQPPSPRSRRVKWLVPARGPVQQWVDDGDGFELVAIVRSASATDEGVTLSVETETGWSWVGTSLRVGDKLREIDMVDTRDGRTIEAVKDGHDRRTGAETGLIERCSDTLASL